MLQVLSRVHRGGAGEEHQDRGQVQGQEEPSGKRESIGFVEKMRINLLVLLNVICENIASLVAAVCAVKVFSATLFR